MRYAWLWQDFGAAMDVCMTDHEQTSATVACSIDWIGL
jgi:hypothetical protein